VFRRGKMKDLSVVVAEVEPDESVAQPSEREGKPSSAAQQLGLTVRPLTEAQKKELKLRGGVLVAQAVGPAARAGLREGDIILALANVEVLSVKDFEAVLARADKGKPLNVLFRRGDWVQYTLIRPAK